jgi:hypothetical protein
MHGARGKCSVDRKAIEEGILNYFTRLFYLRLYALSQRKWSMIVVAVAN